MSSHSAPLLQVEDLEVSFPGAGARRRDPHQPVVSGVHFAIRRGETLGLIGASGAGKTMTALAILGLVPAPGRITAGRIVWRGRDLVGVERGAMRAVRGREIGMVFQDPSAALHPMLRIDFQVAEAIRAHQPGTGWSEALARATELLEGLGVARVRIRHAPYPHQWSGGMCQRAMLAMALANGPDLLIADEPTTALDATNQAQVLGLLEQRREESGAALLLVSHDLAVIAEMADRVVVMQGGRVVETGTARQIFDHPAHPHTSRLIEQAPRPLTRPVHRPRGATVLSAEQLKVVYRTNGHPGFIRAVDDVSLVVSAGETLGVVGESGAGKSSLARALLRLSKTSSGEIRVGELALSRLAGTALQRARARIQIVFQNPFASLNPRRTVGETLAEPLRIHGHHGDGSAGQVTAALNAVGLPAAFANRFPRQLSGGERQRVAIARALVLAPQVLVLDEPVSSLDAPTRQGILDLLVRLQAELGLGYLFISHDLAVIREVADRVAVMYHGRIVESGAVRDVVGQPRHPYTRELLAAQLARHPRDRGRLRHLRLASAPPEAVEAGVGCAFRGRCPMREARCFAEAPVLVEHRQGHATACHFAGDLE